MTIEWLKFRITERLIRFYWWCEWILENTPFRTRTAIAYEPISTATLISLIIAGASFGTNLLLSVLNRPKVPQQVNGKLTGDFTLTDSIYGAPIARIYGGRPSDGSPGGVECGTNFIWMSDIRKVETQTPGSTGGGKGAPKPPPNVTDTYKVDIAGLVGAGRLRLLRMKWNEDIVYSIFGGSVTGGGGTRYEAEDADIEGGASTDTDGAASGGVLVVGVGDGGSVTFSITNDAGGGPLAPIEPPSTREFFTFEIHYRSSSDLNAYVQLDGTGGIYTFPSTSGGIGIKTIQRIVSDVGDPFSLSIFNPDAAAPDIDCVDVTITSGSGETLNTGVLDDLYPAEAAQDNRLLPDPYAVDTQAAERFNAPVPEPDGSVLEISLVGGASLAWYDGAEDQDVDAVIDANISSIYGANSTPAFQGTSYFRIQDLDFTKYGSIPSIRCVVENMDTQTVSEILLTEAEAVGLTEDDLDLTAGDDRHCRGYYVSDVTAPAQLFEDLGYLHFLSFAETSDGVVKAVDLSDRTVVAALTEDDLGAYVIEETEEPPLDNVVTTVPEESEDLLRTLELQFNNPLSPADYNTDRVAYNFPFTASQQKESKSLNLTLLPDEAASLVRRDLQIRHLKQAPDAIVTTHKWAWLNAGDCISLPIDGQTSVRRIEEKTGSAPGTYEISLTNEDIFVLADDGTVVDEGTSAPQIAAAVSTPAFPANTIGTILDIPPITDRDLDTPGVYVAACSKGSGQWNGAQVMRLRGAGYEPMASLTKQAGMGVTVNALDPPSGSSGAGFVGSGGSRTLTVDFYGDFNPSTVTDDQATDGANPFCVGNEIVIIKDWTRVDGYPNRWTGTGTYDAVRNSANLAEDHEIGERVVYLDDSVKFVALDKTEVGVARTWKFVTYGADTDASAEIGFTFYAHNLDWIVPTPIVSATQLYPNDDGKLILVDSNFHGVQVDLILPATDNCIAGVTRFLVQDIGSHGVKVLVANAFVDTLTYPRLNSDSVDAATAVYVTPASGVTIEVVYRGDAKWSVIGGPVTNA